MDFDDDREMVQCPYNKTHRMLRKRLQQHLLKCRINYPDVELLTCHFNLTHRIPEPEFISHVTNCPDRKIITQYKYGAPEEKEEERIPQETVECDEDWDNTEVEDYNPQKYLENAKVLRRPDAFQPAERKAFVKMESKRLDALISKEEEADANLRPKTPPPPHIDFWPSAVKSAESHLGSSNRSRSRSPQHTSNLKVKPEYDEYHDSLRSDKERDSYFSQDQAGIDRSYQKPSSSRRNATHTESQRSSWDHTNGTRNKRL